MAMSDAEYQRVVSELKEGPGADWRDEVIGG